MRLHPLSAVTGAFQRGLVVGSFVFFLFAMGSAAVPGLDGASALVFVLAPLGFAVGVAYQVAYYFRFEYDLTPDTLDIYSGVVGRKEREIPYRRVQNVDVTESIVHRILGVAVVNVETAGGSQTEAVLNFVAADEARRLQREIRERRAAAQGESRQDATTGTAEGEVAPPGEPTVEGPATSIFALDPAELIVYSLSSFRVGTLVFLLFGLPLVQDYVLAALAQLAGAPVDVDTVTRTPDLAFLAGLLLLGLGVLVSWVLSAVITFTEYYDFTLGRQGEDLVYERGLLQRYSGSIPTEKVQTITITEPVLMRVLGYAGLTVETAGYSPGQSNGEGSQAAIPLADRERTLSLAKTLEPFDEPSFTRPPTVARRRYAVRYGLVVIALTAVFRAVAVFTGEFGLWFSPLVLLVVVPVAAHLKWAHRGYFAGDRHFVVRSGFWTQTTRVVPYYRLQTVIRERTIFQRRLGLAHLTADTATSSTLGRRDATAYDIDAEDARRLFDLNRERLQASLDA